MSTRVSGYAMDVARKVRDIADLFITRTVNSSLLDRIAPALMTTRVSEHQSGVQVVIPAAHGSLGDSALAAGVDAGAEQLGKTVHVWVPGSVSGWSQVRGGVHSLSRLRVGNTTLLNGHAKRAFGSSATIVIGADTIGGDYLHGFIGYRVAALRQAASNGECAMLVNFSMSETPTPEALRLLRRLPASVEHWARDRYSQQRATRLLGREVHSAPDVGALARVEPTPSSLALIDRIGSGNYIVLSPNAHMHTKGWLSREQNMGTWVNFARQLDDDMPVVVLPHDLRARPGDIMMSRELAETIRSRMPQKTVELFVPSYVGEAKSILSQALGLVSGRMHACVGALSTGVPTVGIEYLDKFKGQFEWYQGLGDVISYTAALDSSQLMAVFEDALARASGRPRATRMDINRFPWLERAFSVSTSAEF